VSRDVISMSDEEDEQSEPEEEVKEPSEAELALKKRREAQGPQGAKGKKGLDDAAKELLQSNKQDRQRMEEEIKELRDRNEKRKKEREVEEKRLAAERAAEEERRRAVEEDKRRKKEEEDQTKQKARANKMAEFEKWKNPSKPNFVISKKSEDGEEEEQPSVVKKSKEVLDAEKKAILHQRIVPLSIDGFDQSKLSEKAKELHKLICRLEGEKYDHEMRFKAQQVDMMELAERARQANKVGRGGLKRVQVTADEVDDFQARFAGTPAKVEMYSKYERQMDKRAYVERKDLYTGPIFSGPPDRIKPKKIIKWSEEGLPQYEELAEGLAEGAKEE